MTYKLFTASLEASNDLAVDLPGFSHWGQPYTYGKRSLRRIYFYAKHRRQAAKHLGYYAGINTPCDLSEGKACPQLLARCIINLLDAA
jgi:hypothetical protein